MSNTLVLLRLTTLIMVSSTLFVSCKESEPKEEEKINAITPVTLTKISDEAMQETLELNAVSSFLKKNTIKSTAIGVIEAIEVNLGDKVEKGQSLFLIKTKEALAISESNASDSSLRFRGTVQIRASKSGVITSLSHQKGDYVQDGDELAVIAELSSLVFLLEVPFEYHSFLKKTKTVDILLPDGRTLRGLVQSNLAQMNIASQTENFILTPSPVESLPENLIARIKLIKSSKKEAKILPKQAVLSNETQTEFWVMKLVNDSMAIKVPVVKGIENTTQVEILQPVFNGDDKIILTGNYGLADSALVSILKP